jgi:hypothetical protein
MNKPEIFHNYSKNNEIISNILLDLENIIKTEDNFEGNCFYYNKTFTRKPEFINKQVNLYWVGCKSQSNICEIGFNAGHSALLFLLGNPNENINFTIFDINTHSYTDECFKYIKDKFPVVNFTFVEGDSVSSIPKWLDQTKKFEFFDVVHIDGCHLIEILKSDFANSIKMLKKDGIVIIDDTQKEHINRLVDIYISTGIFEEITYIFETEVYKHRILKKII